MFNKILVANRGEIAVRIIQACREMGLATVAVFSEADRNAMHSQLADEAVCIGPAKASESYLNMQNIISAAYKTKAAAIHPGFGFLAENAMFAAMCEECNIIFIGPPSDVINLMGNKANARHLMKKTGVPVVPGSDGTIKSMDEARAFGDANGFPLMIKAAAGGGGRGIRIVKNAAQFKSNINAARAEAKAAFGDDRIYLEKLIENARHIEVQILADNFGNIIHLGERDCSIQRRCQKIIEEAPCPVLDEKKRRIVGELAVKAAKAAGYKNAGTVEFLYEPSGKFYFMEMNARLQVEHPVTEATTGIDIVKRQIRIAMGEPLELKQKDVRITGCAIECRINAETPDNNFLPSSGTVNYLLLPGGNGIRVDSALYAGGNISPYYDSLIAKIIAKAATREEAIAKMKRALGEIIIRGIDTNVDFHMKILNDERYIKSEINTAFIDSIINTAP